MSSTESDEDNAALIPPSVIRKGLCIFENEGWTLKYIFTYKLIHSNRISKESFNLNEKRNEFKD